MTTEADLIIRQIEAVNRRRAEHNRIVDIVCYATVIMGIVLFVLCLAGIVHAQELTASYYSLESLKKEGTFAYSKGQMANGRYFSDDKLTAAAWAYPLGTFVRVTNKLNGKSVVVEITDRTARRFAKTRIDLSLQAMRQIHGIERGLVPVTVREV